MCYGEMGEFWNKTKMIDPIASQSLEHQTDLMSDAGESLGKRWNMPWLEQEGKYNKDHTSEALAKASVATLMGWLGAGGADSVAGAGAGLMGGAGAAGAAGGAAGTSALTAAELAALQASVGSEGLMAAAYGATVPGVSQGSAQAAMLAEQTGQFGAYGLGKTMQAASGAEGLSTGQGLMGKYGGNFLSNMGGPKGQQFAMNQGLKMMQPEQPQHMPPPPRYHHQEQQSQPMYGQSPYGQEIPEELKRKLRAMGYPV